MTDVLVTVNNNSPIQDYVHLDNQTQPTFAPLLIPINLLWSNSQRGDLSDGAFIREGCLID